MPLRHRPSRSAVLSPVRRSPRLLHRQLAGSKRQSSDAGHLVDHYARTSQGMDSVSSDVSIISELELTRCTDVLVIVIIESRRQPLSSLLAITARATYYFLAHTYNQHYYAFIKLRAVSVMFDTLFAPVI